ncbi:hypothetical protein HD554DRAFT_2177146 [Boletus coccyginus]|nr:hypothetical protein HD554DRAFT_2177146 [Boletus coccyginus]
MAPNLTSGDYKIVTLLETNPLAGISLTGPDFQDVYVGGPVTKWVVEQDGNNTYRFHIGGYASTGIIDDNVAVSTNPKQDVEWIATYREYQNAYTIEPADNIGKGWTTPFDSEASSDPVVSLFKSLDAAASLIQIAD